MGTQKAGADDYRCYYCRILYPGDVCDLHNRLSERGQVHHIVFLAKPKTSCIRRLDSSRHFLRSALSWAIGYSDAAWRSASG